MLDQDHAAGGWHRPDDRSDAARQASAGLTGGSGGAQTGSAESRPLSPPSALLEEPRQATIATFEGQPVQARFPLYVVMFGVECVCIPEARYDALTKPAPKVRRANRLSRLDKDVEVRDFITDRLGREDQQTIRLAAIERFGTDRVPSSSALNRFVIERSRQDGQSG